MSVVYHRSTGKMILKNIVAAIILSFAWIKSVTGSTSYSNVFLQSGPGVALYDPMGLRSAQLAPLSAAPLMSNLLPPCVSPCVIPSQQVAALTPVASSSANFVTYKSPIRVPVVVAPSNDDNTSYEYSYVVYDEDTGDQKAQKETSDGSVVRGQYSLIQPDGYVRQVQYTADDLKGFNAVVNNFLPEEEAKAVSPCPEVKNEPLKETKEKTDESHDLEPEAQREAHKGESPEDSKKDKQSSKTQPEPEKQKDQELEIHQERGGQELHKINEEPAGPTVHEDHGELQGQEVQATEVHPSPEKHSEPENQGAHSTEGHGNEEKIEQEPRAIQVAEVLPTYVDALVSYNDVIKCIQSAISRANTAQPSTSPLTYIILNKPC